MSVYKSDGDVDSVDPVDPVDPVEPTDSTYLGCFTDVGSDRYSREFLHCRRMFRVGFGHDVITCGQPKAASLFTRYYWHLQCTFRCSIMIFVAHCFQPRPPRSSAKPMHLLAGS